jgi:hypothetical protein
MVSFTPDDRTASDKGIEFILKITKSNFSSIMFIAGSCVGVAIFSFLCVTVRTLYSLLYRHNSFLREAERRLVKNCEE